MASSPTTVDYIVVGGGTAGLVVANRLTEDPNVHVLVLEAGSSHAEDPRVNIPALWTTLMGSEADWKYHTVPQVKKTVQASSVPSPTVPPRAGLIRSAITAGFGRPTGQRAARQGSGRLVCD